MGSGWEKLAGGRERDFWGGVHRISAYGKCSAYCTYSAYLKIDINIRYRNTHVVNEVLFSSSLTLSVNKG